MENRENYWNDMYMRNLEISEKDLWLKCYMNLIKDDDRIIEFGCGEGYLSEHLLKSGYSIISTDISLTALENFKARVPEAEIMKVDLAQKLPFGNSSFNVIIADLCLHYFSAEETSEILEEMKRILKGGGFLFARVNSDRDYHYRAGKGVEVEKGFYNQDGHYKRFFNRESVINFFTGWKELSVSEKTTSKYKEDKHVFEIIAGK